MISILKYNLCIKIQCDTTFQHDGNQRRNEASCIPVEHVVPAKHDIFAWVCAPNIFYNACFNPNSSALLTQPVTNSKHKFLANQN